MSDHQGGAIAKEIIDASLYMVLGTADPATLGGGRTRVG
jgi:hypothetical protein